jgi:transcriptional regulator with XRE-family HTH domain
MARAASPKSRGQQDSARGEEVPISREMTRDEQEVNTFEFQIFCSGMDTSDDSFLDALYEAGCDDATVFFKDGYVCLDFSRQAESAERAVLSAISDIYQSGLTGEVVRVEPEDLASLSEIAQRVGVTRSSLQKYARGESRVGQDFPRPVQGILASRRELFSTFEVMQWMIARQRKIIDKQVIDLFRVISLTNKALLLKRAEQDEKVTQLLAQLTALEATCSRHDKSFTAG